MRLQLSLALALSLGVVAGPARADGTLAARGVYYKERSTRVMQPMLDGMFEVGARGLVTAHFLVDAITSASSGSGAANAAFTERRYEGGAGYTHELDGPAALTWLDRIRLGGEAKYSTESDYESLYIGGRAEAEVAQKNAVFGLGGGVATDTITNAGAQSPMGGPLLACDARETLGTETRCGLTTYVGFASASQILSKNALVAMTYDVSKLDGFQANPYRLAITASGLEPERHPNARLRQAVAISGRLYVPATQTTFIGAYRYYRDDWHIRAHTPELRIVQEVGALADASIRYRYYHQTAAYFYKDRYPALDTTMIQYITDDPKMSAFDGHVLEAKLGVLGEEFELTGRWAGARIEGVLEYIIQHNRFGDAVVAHVALTVPFDY
jgi:Protein of unknown function (DUF3570)